MPPTACSHTTVLHTYYTFGHTHTHTHVHTGPTYLHADTHTAHTLLRLLDYDVLQYATDTPHCLPLHFSFCWDTCLHCRATSCLYCTLVLPRTYTDQHTHDTPLLHLVATVWIRRLYWTHHAPGSHAFRTTAYRTLCTLCSSSPRCRTVHRFYAHCGSHTTYTFCLLTCSGLHLYCLPHTISGLLPTGYWTVLGYIPSPHTLPSYHFLFCHLFPATAITAPPPPLPFLLHILHTFPPPLFRVYYTPHYTPQHCLCLPTYIHHGHYLFSHTLPVPYTCMHTHFTHVSTYFRFGSPWFTSYISTHSPSVLFTRFSCDLLPFWFFKPREPLPLHTVYISPSPYLLDHCIH